MNYNEKIGELEALLFIWSEPISIKEIGKFLDLNMSDTKVILNQLERSLSDPSRGIELKRFGDCVQLSTKLIHGKKIREKLNPISEKGISQAMIETLIIIAIHQPALKAEIERIRGVKSDSSISKLIDMGLVKVFDRLETIGRPNRYATTDDFLKYFGFRSIDEFILEVNNQASNSISGDKSED
ncbi:MAG: SMC-Scp complex subunit ScpB [Tissierellia bacterium]|nr:SMC-Scp complex subunit ScpB [Tissierellia bacterium]